MYGCKLSAVSSSLLNANGENLITDQKKIRERWIDHFDGVLNRPWKMNDDAIDRLPKVDGREVELKRFYMQKIANVKPEQHGCAPSQACLVFTIKTQGILNLFNSTSRVI